MKFRVSIPVGNWYELEMHAGITMQDTKWKDYGKGKFSREQYKLSGLSSSASGHSFRISMRTVDLEDFSSKSVDFIEPKNQI